MPTRGAVEDLQTGVDIAALERQAADLETQAARLGVQVSELARRRANTQLVIATLEETLRRTAADLADQNLQASVSGVEAAQAELDGAYDRALALGIDPQAGGGLRRAGSPTSGLSISGVFNGVALPAEDFRSADLDDAASSLLQRRQAAARRLLAAASEPVVGMIQWVNLLRVRPADAGARAPARPPAVITPLGLYLRLVDAVHQVHTRTALQSVRDVAATINQQYRQASELASLEFARLEDVAPGEIQWFDAKSPSLFVREMLESLPADKRQQVIGAVPFRLTTGAVGLDERGVYRLSDPDAAYYVIHMLVPPSINVSPALVHVGPHQPPSTTQLFFYLVPPADSFGAPRCPGGTPAAPGRLATVLRPDADASGSGLGRGHRETARRLEIVRDHGRRGRLDLLARSTPSLTPTRNDSSVSPSSGTTFQ